MISIIWSQNLLDYIPDVIYSVQIFSLVPRGSLCGVVFCTSFLTVTMYLASGHHVLDLLRSIILLRPTTCCSGRIHYHFRVWLAVCVQSLCVPLCFQYISNNGLVHGKPCHSVIYCRLKWMEKTDDNVVDSFWTKIMSCNMKSCVLDRNWADCSISEQVTVVNSSRRMREKTTKLE